MKNRIIKWAEPMLLLLLALTLSFATALERQQQEIAGSLIRLHISASSDSREDQQIKLQARDALLTEAAPILEQADSRQEALELLRQELPRLENRANQVLTELGDTHRARVSLGRELFGTRYYSGFALPGGYYDALRVSIGGGEGKNWWCVVYPQLCASAAREEGAVEAMAGMEDGTVGILACDTPEYRFRFRILELYENLIGWFRAGDSGIPVSG